MLVVSALPTPAVYTVRYGHHRAVRQASHSQSRVEQGSAHASEMSRLVRLRAARVAQLRRDRLRRQRSRRSTTM